MGGLAGDYPVSCLAEEFHFGDDLVAGLQRSMEVPAVSAPHLGQATALAGS